MQGRLGFLSLSLPIQNRQMKAEELAARYVCSPNIDTVINLATEVVLETKAIASKRNVQTDAAMTAILREQEDKWKAFARRCPSVRPGAFKLVLHTLVPVAEKLLP
jgi:hypothetical protein